MIIMELAPFGSLWSLVQDRFSYPLIPVSLSVAWLSDLIDAIKHIHSKGVVHKDIKCENLLVFSGMKIKLSDFGLAKRHISGVQSTVSGGGTGALFSVYSVKCEVI